MQHLHASWNDPEEIEGDDYVGERRIINHQSQVLVCESEKGKSGLRASGHGLWNRAGTAHHCAEMNEDPGCRYRDGRSGDGNTAKSSSDGVHFLSEQNKSKCFHSVPKYEDELGA